jgi:hypothetical protein
MAYKRRLNEPECQHNGIRHAMWEAGGPPNLSAPKGTSLPIGPFPSLGGDEDGETMTPPHLRHASHAGIAC